MKIKQEELVNHLKNTGFVFSGSEIYGGLANSWDYGPLGVLLKNNIKKLWNDFFVIKDPNCYSLDSAIILNKNVWKASGHLDKFSDPLIDCKNCKSRFRADKLIEQKEPNLNISEHLSNDEFKKLFKKYDIHCPLCNKQEWTDVRNFNLMFKTFQGVTEDNLNTLYLRPETAQGIFINFKNVQRTMRAKLPFGIGQIGKSFRNEITPGNFIFRTREFEQMELEYFTFPESSDKLMEDMLKKIKLFLNSICKIKDENLNWHEQTKDELAHYSKRSVDVQYNFPHGMSELWGIANRGNYDLMQHMNSSKEDLSYLDQDINKKIIPCVIEPSVGVERLFYALCLEAYELQELEDGERIVMHFPNWISPIKLAILPLTNKLNEHAKNIYDKLIKEINGKITYDSSGSIGRRYRRQDSIGTPFCLTVDFDTIEKNIVTIRNRDTMKQIKLNINDVSEYINENIKYKNE